MLKNVQALRAIAALLVVFEHLNFGLEKSDPGARLAFFAFRTSGNFGVDLFFVISGFIMVVTNWKAFGNLQASPKFLIKRFVRIYPPYWFVLLPILLGFFVNARTFMHAHIGNTDILSSVLLLPQVTAPLLMVSWTLTFELLFYIIFACILPLNRVYLVPLLAAWAILEIIMFVIFHRSLNPVLNLLGAPLPIEFIMGAIIGTLYSRAMMPKPEAVGLVGSITAIGIWFGIAVPGLTIDPTQNDLARVLEYGIPAALLVYAAVALERRANLAVNDKLVYLGDSSYALYLWHMPVFVVLNIFAMRLHVHGVVADFLLQLLMLASAVTVAIIVYRYVERPMTVRLNQLFRVGSRQRTFSRSSQFETSTAMAECRSIEK